MPQYNPTGIPHPDEITLVEAVEYVELELRRISDALTAFDQGKHEVLTVEPVKPREGQIVYANGANWDPGSGEGPYYYDGTTWQFMGGGGGGGGGAFTAFTQDLGESRRSGTFDITGLSGLTAGKPVVVIQTMDQIASKGNARDEFEMDPITLTGYVVDATTIRVLWACAGGRNVAVGTYAFAYQVGGLNGNYQRSRYCS